MSTIETQPESKAYSQMLSEVEGILTSLDQKDLDLDHMVEQVEKGYKLISSMKLRLEQTRKKVETLQVEWDNQNQDNESSEA